MRSLFEKSIESVCSLFDRYIETVFSLLGCEFFAWTLIGGSVLLAVFSVMQRLGIAPASEADRGWWIVGVFAAVVFGILGSFIALIFRQGR